MKLSRPMIATAGLLMTFAIASADPAPEPPPQAKAAGYSRLVFDDEFNTLDLALGDDSSERRWYADLWYDKVPSPASGYTISDGVLTMTTNTPLTGRRLGMAAMTTLPRDGSNRGLFRYGYFEARLKWPISPNNWGAFWLLDVKPARDNKMHPAHCEIDIVEAYKVSQYNASVHDWRTRAIDGPPNGTEYPLDPDDHHFFAMVNQWNTYGVLWQPGKISFYRNDRLTHEVDAPKSCDESDMYIILNAQKWANLKSPDAPAILKTERTFQVDWVRVYQ